MKNNILIILLVIFTAFHNANAAESNIMKEYDEVSDFTIPPWNMYPELQYRSIGWRMGYGEYYMIRWSKYYFTLNTADMDNYKAKYPEPESWNDFYKTIETNHIKRQKLLDNIHKNE